MVVLHLCGQTFRNDDVVALILARGIRGSVYLVMEGVSCGSLGWDD